MVGWKGAEREGHQRGNAGAGDADHDFGVRGAGEGVVDDDVGDQARHGFEGDAPDVFQPGGEVVEEESGVSGAAQGNMNMKNKQYRQGDVLIERIETTIKTPMKPAGRIILAHGEVTGHAHEIHDLEAVEHFQPDKMLDNAVAAPMLLKLGRKAELRHQEHGTIELPAGSYRVTRQREYSPEAIRNVAD